MPNIASNKFAEPTLLRDTLLPKLISGKLDVENLDIDTGQAADALEAATA